ncbi:Uncharacterised protein [Sphingobacterium multivorum]|uniref:hypothetical protein n=1 Tax=Sphingobacterium multivorum TaxID=28454 RepID=UPI000DF8B3C8|nr:hypothetical protein [Sphingobacterium multivorum]QQT44917.1 hypothetical protein I6J00_25010 [Sphingobacterium multivorum]SUJ18397.1 Uncharacterised protein [Sphingobacterium multivorum]
MKKFTTHKPEEIPPIGDNEFCKCYEISEYYFSKVIKVDGAIDRAVSRYDHSRKKWLTSGSVNKELIEYYKEVKE